MDSWAVSGPGLALELLRPSLEQKFAKAMGAARPAAWPWGVLGASEPPLHLPQALSSSCARPGCGGRELWRWMLAPLGSASPGACGTGVGGGSCGLWGRGASVSAQRPPSGAPEKWGLPGDRAGVGCTSGPSSLSPTALACLFRTHGFHEVLFGRRFLA